MRTIRADMMRYFRIPCGRFLAGMLLLTAGAAYAQTPTPPKPLVVDANGTVHVPAMSVPISEFLSPAGKNYVTEHLHQMGNPKALVQKNGVPLFLAGYLSRLNALYPVERMDTSVGGVHVYVYTPKGGISPTNQTRVLINLHGGGFHECWPGCAEIESIPIAALARIKVITLDYRQAPKYRFPAASEDVAAVYKALLKTYRPKDIGIYGCSAGGMLTGEAMAWFEKHGLPMPGAIGIFCAGLAPPNHGFGGDANYMSAPIGEATMMFAAPPEPSHSGKKHQSELQYFEGANLHDPLVSPAVSLPVLAKFPPTLVITGTRDFAMSSAVYTHSRLVKAGVDAELHVWEGLFHGFFYNPDVPESRDCYNVIVDFFNRHLGSH